MIFSDTVTYICLYYSYCAYILHIRVFSSATDYYFNVYWNYPADI